MPFLATAFGTFLIRQVFMTLPRDLRDAAAIDGVGHLGFLRHVAVPLVRPTVGAMAALAFLSTWNQYLWPNLITTESDMYTLQSGLKFLSQSALDQPNLVMAAGDHRVPADRRRAAGLPAPARARPDRGRRQGMTRRSLVALAGALAGCALVAACGSGESILQAGNDPVPATTTTTTDPGPPPTAAPGETLPPTTTTTPPTIATTTTTPLSSLPPCPVDALDAVTAPVELTFWFGLGANIEGVLTELTNEYNASQSKVHVNLENQAGYKQTIDKYLQSSQDSRPDLVMFPEYMVQQIADSGTAIPIGACIEASGFDVSPYLPRALRAYATEGVQWAMPFNASVPVLYFNEVAFQNAGLDITDPPVTLDELRQASQAIVDSRRRRDGDRARQRRRLRWRLVPRAVVRPGRRAVRRQRQRAPRPGDPGALRRARSASRS